MLHFLESNWEGRKHGEPVAHRPGSATQGPLRESKATNSRLVPDESVSAQNRDSLRSLVLMGDTWCCDAQSSVSNSHRIHMCFGPQGSCWYLSLPTLTIFLDNCLCWTRDTMLPGGSSNIGANPHQPKVHWRDEHRSDGEQTGKVERSWRETHKELEEKIYKMKRGSDTFPYQAGPNLTNWPIDFIFFPFLHLVLNAYHVPGCVPGTKDRGMNGADRSPASAECPF